MSALLDRAVWNSLCGPHSRFAAGDDLARRFVREIGPIAAMRDQSRECLNSLAGLFADDDDFLAVIEVGGIPIPDGLVAEKIAPIFQMTTHQITAGPDPDKYIILSDDDAPEMLELARLTEPGPFSTDTHKLGRFIGIRVDGRLAAMAGERMKLPGYTEVSAVCTHPDFQGRGYAAMLSRIVARRILDRGEQPFLHAYEINEGAIALYTKLGFVIRQRLIVTMLRRDQ